MQVFISWSGPRSKEIAEAIRLWLPKVLQSVKPWMSDQDIAAGSRWLTEVSAILNNTSIGLICITPENQHNPWLLFEAGALSKTVEQTCVCPLVFEMSPGQMTGPLTQFQANSLDRVGIGKVLSTINNNLGERRIEPQQLDEILDVWWPKLQERLTAVHPVTTSTPTRTTGDQLEELLILAREQLRRENIRIEASRERDEKLDSMLDFIERAGMSMNAFQGNAQAAITSMMSRVVESQDDESADGVMVESSEVSLLNKMMSTMSSGQLDGPSMQAFVRQMREMQERDKEHRQQMISPPNDAEQA